MSNREIHLPTTTIDALALEGALDPSSREAAEAHLRSCSKCQAAANAAAAARRTFTADVLPRTFEGIQRRSALHDRKRVVRLALQVALPSIALAAAIMLVLRSVPSVSPNASDDRYLAVKGDASLRVVAKRGWKTIEVRDGVVLDPNDRIRFVVEPGGLPYLLIVSVDGHGVASVYYPYEGRESARLSSPGKFEAPSSIVLDEAPGPERLYALLSQEPIAASEVVPALEAIGRKGREGIVGTLELPVKAQKQLSIVFEKSVP